MKHDNYCYRGNWYNGKPQGSGREEYGQGRFYVGEFKNGVKDGRGNYIDSKIKEEYEGHFKDGFMDGQGRYHVNDSLVYEGQF
jgi:hypothetical protein